MRLFSFLVAVCLNAACPAMAQGQFTTAAEVRPILDMTRTSWIAVREYDGQDLLYVTQIASWRCGLNRLAIRINGQGFQAWGMEPCYADTAAPNAFKSDAHLPFVAFPLGSIQTIDVLIELDDGSQLADSFTRAGVQIN